MSDHGHNGSPMDAILWGLPFDTLSQIQAELQDRLSQYQGEHRTALVEALARIRHVWTRRL